MLFLLSCKDREAAGVLSHEDMQAVLVDVHIVDGTLFELPAFPDTLYKYSFAKYQRVFEQHHTDSAQFKKSFIYYSNRPDQLFKIYEKVVPAIKFKADSAATVKRKADSLENIRQQKINTAIAKRAADSVKRISDKKLKADSLKNKKNKLDTTANLHKKKILLERAKKIKGKNAISR